MDWMIPLNLLNPQQARILEEICSNRDVGHWIAGYAGTGKTIVITHALERLAARTRTATICFLTYTHALKDLVSSGLSHAARRRVTVDTIDTFRTGIRSYDYIVVDEIQDVKEEDIALLLRRATHLIAAGDPDQSIYLGRVDPQQLRLLLNGAKKHTLKHIQRLSLNVFQLATSILPDAGIIRGANVRDEGNKGKMIEAATAQNEFRTVYEEAFRVCAVGEPSAVLFPTHTQIYEFARTVAAWKGWGTPPERVKRGPVMDYSDFNAFFEGKSAPLRFLGSNNGSLPESDESRIVYLMTYHSSKGLDFNNVFLPDLSSGVCLDAKAKWLSSPSRERRHLFVAITRAKENIYFSHHGEPHQLVDELPRQCLEKFKPPRKPIAA